MAHHGARSVRQRRFPARECFAMTLCPCFRSGMRHHLGLASGTFALAAFALAACAGPNRLRAPGYCAPPSADRPSIPSERPSPSAPDQDRIAALIGLRATLHEHPRTEAGRLLAVERVEAARLAVAATAAELECERQRATQAADALSRTMSTEAQALT